MAPVLPCWRISESDEGDSAKTLDCQVLHRRGMPRADPHLPGTFPPHLAERDVGVHEEVVRGVRAELVGRRVRLRVQGRAAADVIAQVVLALHLHMRAACM